MLSPLAIVFCIDTQVTSLVFGNSPLCFQVMCGWFLKKDEYSYCPEIIGKDYLEKNNTCHLKCLCMLGLVIVVYCI